MFLQRLTIFCCAAIASGCASSQFDSSERLGLKQLGVPQTLALSREKLGSSGPNGTKPAQIKLVHFAESHLQQPLVESSTEQKWLLLSPDEAVCRALRTARIEEITQREKDVIRSGVNPLFKLYYQSQIDLAEDLIDSVATGEKESLALTVLRLYFGLAEIHAQADVMRRSKELLEKLQVQVDSIVEADIEELRTKISPEDIQRRHLRLEKEKAVLDAKARTLTTQLNVILGLCDRDVYPVWTDCDLATGRPAIELQAATVIGLRCRKDFCSLVRLSNARSRDITAIGRVAAAQFHPSFGEFDVPPNPTLALLSNSLHLKQRKDESVARREQVRNLRDKMEKAIRTEIAKDAFEVQELVKKLDLQLKTVQSWEKQQEQMKAKRAVGKATFDQLLEPKIEGLKAESELYHLASSLEIAMAKLYSSQGILIQQLFQTQHHCSFRFGQSPQPIRVAEQYFVTPDDRLYRTLHEQK